MAHRCARYAVLSSPLTWRWLRSLASVAVEYRSERVAVEVPKAMSANLNDAMAFPAVIGNDDPPSGSLFAGDLARDENGLLLEVLALRTRITS
jgi:hypothetical protein